MIVLIFLWSLKKSNECLVKPILKSVIENQNDRYEYK